MIIQMKKILFGLTIAVASFTACNNNNKEAKVETATITDSGIVSKDSITALPVQAGMTTELIKDYLQVKNALTDDKGTEAATAAKQMIDAIGTTDAASLTADQKKVYDDVKDDIKEHAEHISQNAGKIAHQREHFDMLSKDMYDLLKAVKPTQTLYLTHCPMYNDGKGADWLSEIKDIKNPYYGKKMPDCGVVKEEITP
jgi:hypothetical protein